MELGDNYLINYVGIANKQSLASRLCQHIKSFMSGTYWLYDTNEFMTGKKTPIYKSPFNPLKLDFLDDYLKWTKIVYDQIKAFSIFIAPVQEEEQTLKRIEGFIIKSLKEAKIDMAKKFLDNERVRRFSKTESSIHINMIYKCNLLGMPSGKIKI